LNTGHNYARLSGKKERGGVKQRNLRANAGLRGDANHSGHMDQETNSANAKQKGDLARLW